MRRNSVTLPPRLSQSTYKTVVSRKTSRISLPTLLLGFFIGIILSISSMVVLFNLGFFDQFYFCPGQANCEECPSFELYVPLLASCLATPSSTLTSTATPDIQATATASCGKFESQFPGTPCPEYSVP
jgi:hypothetical protein